MTPQEAEHFHQLERLSDEELEQRSVASLKAGDVLQIAVPLVTEKVDDYGQRRTEIAHRLTRLRVREVKTEADGSKTLVFGGDTR